MSKRQIAATRAFAYAETLWRLHARTCRDCPKGMMSWGVRMAMPCLEGQTQEAHARQARTQWCLAMGIP